jgi:hypothetical protein
MSEGVNAVIFGGGIMLALLFGTAAPVMAQDDSTAPSAGAHEALTGHSIDEVVPNGDILYQNTDKVLEGVDALLVRHYAAHVCFVNKDYPGPGTVPEGYDPVGGNSLNDLLPKYLGTDLDHVVLMRVERSYLGDDDACGLLELTYAYKSEVNVPAPAPVPKKK